MRNALVEKVSANTEVEVPEAMVQHQIDNMLMELNYQLQYQGLNLQQLLEMRFYFFNFHIVHSSHFF